jgi:beta-N-acetylhexosaminidase
VTRILPRLLLPLVLCTTASAARAEDLPPAPQAPRVVAGVELQPIYNGLTPEQRVGQLLVLGFGGTELDDRARALLLDKKPGAVALFARNVGNRRQVRALTDAVRAQMDGQIPPFVAVDQEGGNVLRLRERTTLLPSAMALGATRSAALSETAGRAMGRDLHALGFNMNFAPVLDVNSNPHNPVIGVRSFGEDPEQVSTLGAAFIAGLRASGVAAVAKHFPGHGDTREDSHFKLPSVNHDLARLEQVELAPFRRASQEGLASIMAGHLALPLITESPGLPASLSRVVLTDLLRRRVGFGGIIMTDGLEMEAVAGRMGVGRAAVAAVKAGADMVMVLWFPEKKTEVQRALMAAVQSGEIPADRLEDAVLRVLGEKARLGLLAPVPPPPALAGPRTLGVDDQVAAASVTLLRNQGDVVPLSADQQVLVVAPDRTFPRALQQRLRHVRTMLLPTTAGRDRQRQALVEALRLGRRADVVVVAVNNDVQLGLARALMADRPGRPVVVVSLLSPYVLADIPTVDAYLCTYSYLRPSQVAAARVLTGHAQARGRLPVTIPGVAARGDGILPEQSAAAQAR